MGFFDSFLGSFNPTNLFGSKGNSMLDLMDPGNTFHTGASTRLANQQYQMEYDIAKQNLASQEKWNQKNWEAQMEAYNYQKELNALQMEREDTAAARRVADLKAAGLSPTLAAGSAASATPVHAGNAPQGVAPQMGTPSSVKVQEAMFREGLMKDRMQLATTLMGNIANIARTKAEISLLDAQANQINTMTPIDFALKWQAHEFAASANPYKLKKLALEVKGEELNNDIKEYDLILMSDTHAQNAYKIYNEYLDGELKQAGLDIQHREFILKGLAIDSAMVVNEKAGLELKNLKWDTEYYHTRNMPLGMNFGMFNPLLGISSWADAAGKEAGQRTGDFVGRTFRSIGSKAKSWASRFKKALGADFSE